MSDFKTQSNTIKLVTSALFARKQPLMIVNGNLPGTFLYTNIEPDRVVLYRPTIEDVISHVTIKNENVLDDLYSAFPELKSIIAVINLVKFSTARNKLDKVCQGIHPKMEVRDNGEIWLMAMDAATQFQVGNLIPDHTYSYYQEIVERYNKFGGRPVKRRFRAVDVAGDDKLTLEIVDIDYSDGSRGELGYPIKDGVSSVSVKEYVRKRNLDPMYTILMMVNDATKTAKGVLSYVDDWLDSSTMFPGILWFI